jgi:hypothetical protein
MAEVIRATAVAALTDHGMEPAGAQMREVLERLAHKGQVGVDQRGAMGAGGLGQAGL